MGRMDGSNRIMLVEPHSTITVRRVCCDACLSGVLLSITTSLNRVLRRSQETVRVGNTAEFPGNLFDAPGRNTPGNTRHNPTDPYTRCARKSSESMVVLTGQKKRGYSCLGLEPLSSSRPSRESDR